MISAIALIAFVALAIVCVLWLGPILGTVVWLLAYGITLTIGRWLLRFYDPMRAYTMERSTPKPTGGRAWTPNRRSRRPPSHTEPPF